MFGWWTLTMDTAMLALESQQVIGMRLAMLATGGTAAQAEAERMVTEKIAAAGVATGGTAAGVVAGYRRKVRANARRLSRA